MNGNIFLNENAEELLEQTRPFIEAMMQYNCALKEVQTKFEVLNEEFSLINNRNPIESVKTRIKSPRSIVGKLQRHNLDISLENIRTVLNDVAGIRIICSFPDDIYSLIEMFTRQDDIRVVSQKDYIKNPKPNGYRSFHLIVEIPIFLSQKTEHIRVEVQFRTIAMDFWASLEHKLKYKKGISETGEIAARLKNCADDIARLDTEMQKIREQIEHH